MLFSFSTAKTEKNWGKQNWLFGGLISRTRYLISSSIYSKVRNRRRAGNKRRTWKI